MAKTLSLDPSIDVRDLGKPVVKTVMRRTWRTLWLRTRPVEVKAIEDTYRTIDFKPSPTS